ncbi:Ig-like domain-containing protein [Microbacterium sp. ASV49]|uniref:Ig-like domain-containing protein n=1 Tax=Microbacterium candidum TaxID=3041922 RepID=A0ABT7MXI4_9MICO|nr:Ig-like domain-containing protein [Microbacterium sp. ASV49]MDL9979164.1 Ig-like domain-containing protein [Microbacterium sp. ASV49]
MRHPQSFTSRASRTAHRVLAVAAVVALVALGGPVGAALAAEQPTDAAIATPAPTDAATPIAEDAPAAAEDAPADPAAPAEAAGAAASPAADTSAPGEKPADPPAAASPPAPSLRLFAGPVVQNAGPNHEPVAGDDHFEMQSGTTLVVAAPGILGNDYDPDGDSFQESLNTQPAVGNVDWVTAYGAMSYTAPAGFTGTVSFQYYDKDDFGAISNWATVTIDVEPAGAPVVLPPLPKDDSYVYAWHTPLYIGAPGVLANDDLKGQAVTSMTVVGTSPDFAGAVKLQMDGSFLLTPGIDAYNHQWFRYQVCTAGGCAVGEAGFDMSDGIVPPSGPSLPPGGPQLNHAPVPSDLTSVVDKDTTILMGTPGLLTYAEDPDGDPITVSAVGAPSHGKVVSWGPDGRFAYVPDSGFVGDDEFAFTISDGQLTGTATEHIFVRQPGKVEQSPVAIDDVVHTVWNAAYDSKAGELLANDSDPDGDPITVTDAGKPAHGTLTWASDGTFHYTPVFGFSGTDTFDYTISDGTLKAGATVTIHVVAPACEEDPLDPHACQPGGEGGGQPGDPEPTPDPTPSVNPDPEPSGDREPAGDPQPAVTPTPTTTARAEALAQTGAPDLSGVFLAGMAATAFGMLLAAAARLRRQRR